MNFLNTEERIKGRNRDFLNISNETYKTKREEYAVELRRSKRQTFYNENRAQLQNIRDMSFLDYTVDMQIEEAMKILDSHSGEDLKVQAVEAIRSSLTNDTNTHPLPNLIKTLKDCLAKHKSDFLAPLIALLLGNLASFEPYATQMANQKLPFFLLSYLTNYNLEFTQYALRSLLDMSKFARTDILKHFEKISSLLHAESIQNHIGILTAISELLLDLNKNLSLKIYKHRPLIIACGFLLQSTDYEVIMNTLHSINYVSKGDDRNIQALISSDLTKNSMHLLKYTNLQTPILLALENITCSRNVSFIDHLLDEGLLDLLVDPISSDNIDVVESAYRTINSIVAGSEQHRERLREHKLFRLCLQDLSALDQKCRFEAGYILYIYVLSTSTQNILNLLDFDILFFLKDFSNSQNPLFVKFALTILEKLLQAFYCYRQMSDKLIELGYLDEIENLQDSSNPDISVLASRMIEDYFK